LTITDSTISGNTATGGYYSGGSGGGCGSTTTPAASRAAPSPGTRPAAATIPAALAAASTQGAVLHFAEHCQFDDSSNQAGYAYSGSPSFGGGIFNLSRYSFFGGEGASATHVTITRNQAEIGGGIYNRGTFNIDNAIVPRTRPPLLSRTLTGGRHSPAAATT